MSFHVPTYEDLGMIAEQVWTSYLDPEGVSPLTPAAPTNSPRSGISASVSVTGAWSGHVVVACSDNASRTAAAALLGIEPPDVTPDDVTDALGELANIIGGNVKSLLPEPCALSLPQVVTNGTPRWPMADEVVQLNATWRDEPVAISVLESTAEKEA